MLIIVLKQCPFCGLIWSPRKKDPRWCPRCKRYIYKQLKDVTDVDDWDRDRMLPLWEKEGSIIDSPHKLACSVCGRRYHKLISIDGNLYCRYCLFRLLDETDPEEFMIQE